MLDGVIVCAYLSSMPQRSGDDGRDEMNVIRELTDEQIRLTGINAVQSGNPSAVVAQLAQGMICFAQVEQAFGHWVATGRMSVEGALAALKVIDRRTRNMWPEAARIAAIDELQAMAQAQGEYA